ALSRQVGNADPRILSGPELHHTSNAALRTRVNDVDIFAEVEPNQKERIIIALKQAGNVVGYLGDGINDAAALHAADVGISVDSRVEVAKEAARFGCSSTIWACWRKACAKAGRRFPTPSNTSS